MSFHIPDALLLNYMMRQMELVNSLLYDRNLLQIYPCKRLR